MADVQRFIQQFGPVAAAVSQRIGVAPDVLLGQWGLETGWGKSIVPGTNNLGNIKGPGVAATDNQTGTSDQYRAYPSPAAFGDDFANLIANNYRSAVGAGANAAAYGSALKAGGYAQDPKYAGKLAGAVDMVRKFGDVVTSALSGSANAAELAPAQMSGAPVISATGQRLNGPQAATPSAAAAAAPAASTGDPLLDMAHGVMGGAAAAPAPAAGGAPTAQPEQTADDPLLSMANSVMTAKDQPAKPAPQAPAQPQNGTSWPGGEVGRQLGLTARAAGHGIADTVDLVGAPLNATINTLFGAHLHNPGDTIRAGVDAVTPAPQNALERAVNAGASGMAAAAAGAGAAGTASKMAANPLIQTIGAELAANPGTQIASGAGAGAASQGAQDAGANPYVQLAAGLAGGVAGGAAGIGINAAANRLSRSLGPAVAPSGAAENGSAAFGPGNAPTGVAPASVGGRGSMGAAGTSFANQARAEGVPESLVQKIAAQEKAGTLNATAAERHIEAGSLPVPVELTAGQATGDVNLLSHEQNIRGKAPDLAERFNAQNGQLAANFDAIRDRVAPDVNVPSGTPIGQAIVDAYKQADAPIQEQIARAYEGARNADGTPALVDSAAAMRDFESKIGPTRFRALPSRVQQIFSDAKNNVVALPEAFDRSGGAVRPLTARDLMDIDQTLSGAIGETKNASVQHDIGLLRQAILDAPISPAAGPEAMAAFKSAQAQARARFQAMAADPAYKAAVNDGVGVGEPSPLADAFIQKYVAGGKTANVQNMLQNLSGDPLNQQYIAAGLMDHIKSQAGIDLRTGTGNVSQAALNKTIQNLGQKSDLVFGADGAQTLDRLGNVARYTQEQPRGSYVNNSNTFVAGAANAAKSAMEGAANVAAHGIPVGTWARQAFAKRALGKEAAQSLELGAGLNKLRSISKK
ncbi:TPA: glucosaminidase domain-containing protein [Burkholderia vietnamiensis]|uniref:glucosaminidase domain-containing protein n=1 Tax=Burkholderia vietnamiensis TaxID=60552 RepID=UPI00159302AE|nr:glucosaminidase domain-containing protein [Burkholderia vietnamiensis]MCA8210324.1 glucosaminidase domain-containing protein [Burkholderia vietnamiensis]HDR9100063.1 glucosaminidase domain-containing protein [Burkholderia vietnamiensis]HDR9117352.1 glucosaminidase domain-containing protein [Burkholderia vietnamiensis]